MVDVHVDPQAPSLDAADILIPASAPTDDLLIGNVTVLGPSAWWP